MERMTRSDFRLYVTVWPARTWTREPAAGTLPPSQVAGVDQGPLRTERINPGPSGATAAACNLKARSPVGASRNVAVAVRVADRSLFRDRCIVTLLIVFTP